MIHIDMGKEDFWEKGVSEEEVLQRRHGLAAPRLYAEDLRRMSKDLKVMRKGSRRVEGMGDIVMRIPAAIYFQHGLSNPGSLDGDEAVKTFRRMWEEHADFRMIAGSNPWGKKRG